MSWKIYNFLCQLLLFLTHAICTYTHLHIKKGESSVKKLLKTNSQRVKSMFLLNIVAPMVLSLLKKKKKIIVGSGSVFAEGIATSSDVSVKTGIIFLD